jgi:hypothetical protein
MSNLKFGVEIEAVGASMSTVADALNRAGVPCRVEGYTHATMAHWKVVSDASLTGNMAFELVSPILQGEHGLMQVVRVCEALATIGAKVNNSCGLHVHVDGRALTVSQLANVCKMWLKYETCFDQVLPESRRNNVYCRSIKSKFQTLAEGFDKLTKCTTVAALTGVMNGDGAYRTSRYHKLNLESMTRHGTVEFRQHSGTVDGEKIVNWVKLVTNFVQVAKDAKTIKMTGEGNFDNLLDVAPDRASKKFYRARRAHFASKTAATV